MEVCLLVYLLNHEDKEPLVKALKEAGFEFCSGVPPETRKRAIKDPKGKSGNRVPIGRLEGRVNPDGKVMFDPQKITVYNYLGKNRLRDFMEAYKAKT